MDINLIVTLVILLFAIGGFISSEVVLVTLWRSQEKKRKSRSGSLLSRSQSPEKCYDECMTEFHWDAGHISPCLATCKA
jgi:hypothetical protein